MGYYDNILKLLSLALTFAILFIVIYGCQFKKYRYVEGFTNDDTPPQEEAEEPKKEVAKNTGPELMVGGYFVKSDKGTIYGMKVLSSSLGNTIVMLYDEDGKPLFKQNETAINQNSIIRIIM